MPATGTASLTIAELREFAGFTAAEQRYIRRSLDIGLDRQDAFMWARNARERASIRNQYEAYAAVPRLRREVPEGRDVDSAANFMATLISVSAFDLAQDRLRSFPAYRFLYERLVGPAARPWLPSAFCAAAALPQIRPPRRKTLLQSISEAAATAASWSTQPPVFYPEFVEAEPA